MLLLFKIKKIVWENKKIFDEKFSEIIFTKKRWRSVWMIGKLRLNSSFRVSWLVYIRSPAKKNFTKILLGVDILIWRAILKSSQKKSGFYYKNFVLRVTFWDFLYVILRIAHLQLKFQINKIWFFGFWKFKLGIRSSDNRFTRNNFDLVQIHKIKFYLGQEINPLYSLGVIIFWETHPSS